MAQLRARCRLHVALQHPAGGVVRRPVGIYRRAQHQLQRSHSECVLHARVRTALQQQHGQVIVPAAHGTHERGGVMLVALVQLHAPLNELPSGAFAGVGQWPVQKTQK